MITPQNTDKAFHALSNALAWWTKSYSPDSTERVVLYGKQKCSEVSILSARWHFTLRFMTRNLYVSKLSMSCTILRPLSKPVTNCSKAFLLESCFTKVLWLRHLGVLLRLAGRVKCEINRIGKGLRHTCSTWFRKSLVFRRSQWVNSSSSQWRML